MVAVLLTLPYLRAYMEVRAEQGLRRPLGMSVSMSFLPERDLTSLGYLYGRVLGTGGERLFPGLLTLALADHEVLGELVDLKQGDRRTHAFQHARVCASPTARVGRG